MEKQFGELSKFLTEKRDVELFRSSDLNNTAIYFTEVDDDKREKAKAFFELLRFGLDGGDHQIYVRFPNTDYFVEMLGGGSGSVHGNMMIASGKNVHDVYDCKDEFTIHSHDNNLLISFGTFPRFNFMTKVAEYDKGNPFNQNYPQETFLNYEEIEKALSLKFSKLPENIRRVEYLFKTKDSKKYFVVDCPAYNFKYDNQRFRVVENDFVVIEKSKVNEYPIKNFVRYRDGGTTIITITDKHGVEHKLFSPQQMFDDGKNLVPKFDETELIKIENDTDEWQSIAKLLEIELEPKEEEELN
ncbi:MAG TPA: hypothetical protein VN026_17195 [Bacteroidia bacterium]|jgi:hypothetical protein|nr:hypothetical protein [Bacteroidia bacterium]